MTLDEKAMRKIELWFFRDISDEQRLRLFSLFGLPVDEIGRVHSHQRRCLKRVLSADPSGQAPLAEVKSGLEPMWLASQLAPLVDVIEREHWKGIEPKGAVAVLRRAISFLDRCTPHTFTANGPGVLGSDNCRICERFNNEPETDVCRDAGGSDER